MKPFEGNWKTKKLVVLTGGIRVLFLCHEINNL